MYKINIEVFIIFFHSKNIKIFVPPWNWIGFVVLRRNTRVCLTLRRTREGRDVVVETQFIQ